MRWCAVLVVASCASRTATVTPPAPERSPLATDGPAGAVADPALRDLLEEAWERTMERSPTWASELGDHRFDDRLGDPSADAIAAARADGRGWAERARALTLERPDRLTADLFAAEIEGDLETAVCRYEDWSVSPRRNALVMLNWIPMRQRLDGPDDGANLVARARAFGPFVDATLANLERGRADGLVANATSVGLVIDMLDDQLAASDSAWPLLAPAAAHADWPGFADALQGALTDVVRPALERYRAFLADRVLPAARDDAVPGLASLPNGEACYAAEIRAHTTLELTADEVHQVGLDELERIHGAFRTLGERSLGTAELAEVFERLRTDPALRFETRAEVEEAAASALADARAAMPAWFGVLPAADCVVKPVPDYEAPYTTIAYYRPGAADGSRPGTYYINSWEPTTRPRHEARVLAFHESIPGHHLQIAISQELQGLPRFRRHGGVTAYVEGWALYTERLADEMGLYQDDLDRLGVLSFDAWRAARLVVDTGVHHDGWSREQAVAFMVANTPLAENNIANEVDRYITTPGQALAYKLGQLEILRLRAEAEAALGDAFAIQGFHDAVLAEGALPLPILQAQVQAWVDARLSSR